MTTFSTAQVQPATGSPPAGESSRPLLALAGYIGTLAASAVLFEYWQAEPVPGEAYLLGMCLLAVCLLPIAIWQAGVRRSAPMFELLCMAFAIAFAVPVFLHENSIRAFNSYAVLDWAVTQRAQRFSLLGIAAMIAGYYLFQRSPMASWLPRADLPMDPRRFPKFLFVAFGIGGGLQVLDRLTGNRLIMGLTGAVFSLISFVIGVGIALLAFRVFGPGTESRRYSKLFLYCATGATAVIGTTTGMLEAGFIPLLALLAARWTASQRIPVAWLVAGGVAVVVMNAAKQEYRREVWLAEVAPTVPEQLAVWSDKVSEVAATLHTTEGINDAVVRTVNRFDMLHIFSHVLELTPGEVPYYGGASYEYLLYGWIPRLLWRDKPISMEANIMFALDYGLLIESQRDSVRMGIGFLTEAYANFGVGGVVVIMFVIGTLLSIAATIFNGPQSDGGKAAYVVVLAFFMNGLGSATTMFFFFALHGFIVLPLFLRYYARSWRAPAELPQSESA